MPHRRSQQPKIRPIVLASCWYALLFNVCALSNMKFWLAKYVSQRHFKIGIFQYACTVSTQTRAFLGTAFHANTVVGVVEDSRNSVNDKF